MALRLTCIKSTDGKFCDLGDALIDAYQKSAEKPKNEFEFACGELGNGSTIVAVSVKLRFLVMV